MAATIISTIVAYALESSAITFTAIALEGLSATVVVAAGRALAAGIGAIAGGFANQALGQDPGGQAQLLMRTQELRGNTTANYSPINVIYGETRVGGTVVYRRAQGYLAAGLHLVIVLGEGEVDSLVQSYGDNHPLSDFKASNGLDTTYVEFRNGADSQTPMVWLVDRFPGEVLPEHTFPGIAYVGVILSHDVTGSPPLDHYPALAFQVKGRTLYDPRSGATAWSNNPALVIRDYLTNVRCGKAIPASAIDDASFQAAANYCDELVAIPGGTQKRYTFNGVINVDIQPLDNLREMLTACRGALIWSGGLYKLVLDKQTAATFAFTEDNITGAWQISVGEKKARFNRVRVRFLNPELDYETDVGVVDSPTFRTEDNGLLLEAEIDLPYTENRYMAEQIAQQELKQSRLGITASFHATLAALEVEIGDVVTLTHATPGWSAKKFRVSALDQLPEGEIAVTVREYADSVYTLDDLATWTPPPTTSLPVPVGPQPVKNLAASETLYATRPGAGVKTRITLTWQPPELYRIIGYQVEWRVAGTSAWTVRPRIPVSGTSDVWNDVAAGTYDIRVASVAENGNLSAYSTRQIVVYGTSAPPGNISGLTLQAIGGMALLQWTPLTDLDVIEGGRILIRHSTALSGAAWASSLSIGHHVPGYSALAIVPLKEGTYLLKAEDAGGNVSATAATVTTKQATSLTYGSLSTLTENPTFSGTKTDVVVVDSKLKLDGVSDFDSVASVDALVSWDGFGGAEMDGTYDFSAGMDLTTVTPARLTSEIAATVTNADDQFDSRSASLNDWDDFDGIAGTEADAWVEVRQTDDDPAGTPTWSSWQRLDAAEFRARAFQFRAQLRASDPAFNIEIATLKVHKETVT